MARPWVPVLLLAWGASAGGQADESIRGGRVYLRGAHKVEGRRQEMLHCLGAKP